MPAGIVRSTKPVAVMPFSLSTAFTEMQAIPARVNEYHDGTTQQSALVSKPRRSWQLAKRLTPEALAELRAFWQAQGVGAFYFYNPKETNPPFSYDPTGAATTGRYRARFASQWSEAHGLGLTEIGVELIETLVGSLILMDDLALLIDKSGSLSNDDFANEKAAAVYLVDAFAPLTSGGIVVYSFGNGAWSPVLEIALSHDSAAIKTAINTIPKGGDTPLYATIYTAATQTTAKDIILMTDGQDDISPMTSLAQAIAACVERGIKVHTLGFGNANLGVLQQISTETGGIAYSAATSQSLSALAELLVTEVGG